MTDMQRILVVEDSVLIAMDLSGLLEEAGYSILGPAQDLASALSLIESERLDAVLLDIDLNGVASYPAAQLLRERNVPFAFLSGYGGGYSVPSEFAAYPLVAKPIRNDALLKIVDSLVVSGR
jgi:CheY-like chemotaxis protein